MSDVKKILVLGGSYLQADFVDTAVKSGYKVFVLDRDPEAYLSERADIHFFNIDISNEEEVNAFFVEHKCDIIISPVTEIGNVIAAEVARRNNVRYNSPETVLASTDKKEMRKLLNGSGLSRIKSFPVNEDLRFPKELGLPFIVKPRVNSASRGVSLVQNESDFKKAIDYALHYSDSTNDILIEEYIEGIQYSIETISFNSRHYVVAVTREVLSGPPYFMERMNIIDAEEIHELHSKMASFAKKILDIINVQVGPCHIEIKIQEDAIYLIEVATRSGLLRDKLIKTAGGEDYNKLILNSYLDIELKETIALPSINSFLGIIAHKEDLLKYRDAKAKGLVVEDFFNNKELSENPKMLTDAIGYFFLKSDNADDFEDYKMKL
jgi:biotin carboxylase